MLTPSLSDRIFYITALGYMLHYEPEVRERYAPGRLLTLSSDTGNEHPETKEHVRYLEAFYASAAEHFEHITADGGYHTSKWRSLEHFYSSGNRIGSKSFPRSCTWQLKIAPLYKRLEQILARDYGVAEGNKRGFYEYVAMTGRPIRVLIGFTAEEAARRIDPDEKVPPWMRRCVERVYPLAEIGMTRSDCRDYIRSKGHPVPYPSLCTFCPFKTLFDVHYAATFFPDEYRRWVRLETNKLRAWRDKLPPEKNHGVFPGRTLLEVAKEARQEFGGMTDEQMHERRMAGHGVASRY